MKQVAVFHGKRLPYAPVKVLKGPNGERVIEGVRSFVDTFPNIPFGKRDHRGDWITYSRAEREALAAEVIAKAERAAKKAAKGKPAIKVKEEKEVSSPIKVAEDQSKTHTVKRDGRWVQVGSDNLTAHIEAR